MSWSIAITDETKWIRFKGLVPLFFLTAKSRRGGLTDLKIHELSGAMAGSRGGYS
jgi:hypothetical protein